MNRLALSDIGLSEFHAGEAAKYGDSLTLARVSVQHRDMYKIMTGEKEFSARISGKLDYQAEGSGDYPVVGDWVMIDEPDEELGQAIIHHILTRKSCIARKAAGTGHRLQVIAANIDIIFICMSLDHDFNLRRLERYLSIAWDSMAMPVVVLTKSDICEDIAAKLRDVETAALGVDLVIISSKNTVGYPDISRYLTPGKTAAFIGSSGVGKSTLINRLMGVKVMATGELRVNDKGRHTTTHRQLLVLPDGGVVIDTPGMRELQIADADLTKSFADIEELAKMCRFRDCRHESEPGCAVKQAVEAGRLAAGRLANYKKLQREMVFEERRLGMTAAQAEKLKIVDMMGSLDAPKKLLKNNHKNKGSI